MTAEERASQLMSVAQKDLPPLALKFARKLCSEAGVCMEVYLTAFAVYAQLVEGLTCSDSLYQARQQDVDWFKAEGEDD